jgi:hypothetical protein
MEKFSLPKQIPEDIRRKGSATTLELLRGDIGKRWKLLKHTIVAWTSLPIFRFFCKHFFFILFNKFSTIQIKIKISNHRIQSKNRQLFLINQKMYQ